MPNGTYRRSTNGAHDRMLFYGTGDVSEEVFDVLLYIHREHPVHEELGREEHPATVPT